MVAANSPLATARLAGTVVDDNDAVVPGATVLVNNADKGIKKATRTNDIGLFAVTELLPGNYTVAVQHHGFCTAEIRGLALKVNDQLALKIQLKVGQVAADSHTAGQAGFVERERLFAASVTESGSAECCSATQNWRRRNCYYTSHYPDPWRDSHTTDVWRAGTV